MALTVRPPSDSRWDLVALGEVMLRLDPGDERIQSARQFRAWEGGGEYNVARGLSRCFGASTTIVTAFADNPVGRLIEDLILTRAAWIARTSAGPVRRDRPHGPQRPELHGARLWRRAAVGSSDRANAQRPS